MDHHRAKGNNWEEGWGGMGRAGERGERRGEMGRWGERKGAGEARGDEGQGERGEGARVSRPLINMHQQFPIVSARAATCITMLGVSHARLWRLRQKWQISENDKTA